MRIFRRLLKWLFWLSGGLMMLIVLFLTIPGITVSWCFPVPVEPWIILKRDDSGDFDERTVGLWRFEMHLTLAKGIALPAEGWRFDEGLGLLVYSKASWGIAAGARPRL